MTSSVPDSFSLDELSNMLANAPQEDELHNTNDDKGVTPEDIRRVADEALEYASERIGTPVLHKYMMMTICCRMIEWHTRMGELQIEAGHTESAFCWLRDAGKFQSMMDSLVNICVDDDDFTCKQDD